MAKLTVSGVRDTDNRSELGQALTRRVTVKGAARVQSARAGGPLVSFDDVANDDVVEIELQDGLRLWSRVDNVATDLLPRAQRGMVASDGTLHLPSELRIGPADRSLVGWGIKALKIVGIDIPEQIADFVAEHVEGQLQPGPGLYQCSQDAAARLTKVSRLKGKGPTLIFLHGTASSTPGSFSGLWSESNADIIPSLFRHYEGRILAYQHRSLTESPIVNALALATRLAEILDAGSELHLVSHSRGGLIGELLARGMRLGAAPFTRDDLALFQGSDRKGDRDALKELSAVLEDLHPQITRFVRVSCPARGTTLADGRLDRYVSVLVNLAGLIPGLRGNFAYDALTNLLAGVIKKRTDPSELPGLEAMMPISPLVRMLNNPDVRTTADLHVLGGDLAGSGLFGRLKTLATDLYYRDDHDIVVNTPAMFGGMERPTPIKYWIDTGNQVTHFHYFQRSDTSGRLASALTGSDSAFRTLEARPSAVTSADYRKRATFSKPVVFVLPGIMGSELTVDGSAVWMKTAELARGGLTRLSGAGVIKASGLLPDGYSALCEHLKGTHEVVAFPYDWRKPLIVAADALRGQIDTMLEIAEAAKQPIRLLAHSMGGLVVRTMLADKKGAKTWDRMCQHPGARFIMLGTPNGGSYAIPAMLMGRDALVKKLALIDLRNTHGALLSTIAGFDGVLNLLPFAGTRDFFDRKEWERLLEVDAPEERGLFGGGGVESSKSAGFRWALPSKEALDQARSLADVIRNSPLDMGRVTYVAGVAEETACDIVVDEAAPKGRKVKVMASPLGDGRVLWATGIPKGVRTFYMDTVHGDLACDKRHFDAIVDLLNSGTTSKLGTAPPVRRDIADVVEMREPMPAMVPDEAELVATALGGQRAKIDAAPGETRIAIRVVHDNLTNATSPVLVSHYRHDVIVAGERYLDRRLGGRLSELLRMELYPGPIDTAIVEVNDRRANDQSIHPGAIVAGLGDVGELTPGKLTSTLAYALTSYGADCVGRVRRRQQREGFVPPDTISAPVNALLVGSGEGGVSLADAVRALMTAILQANQRLRGPNDGSQEDQKLTAQIDRVDIVELWQDRAVEALHALRALVQSPEFSAFVVDDYLVIGEEGQRRVRFEQADGWWQRIRVKGAEDGTLDFEAVTQTARAPATLLPTQRGLVDGFIQQAIQTTANDPGLEQTLFEMLVPNDFKPYAPDRRKLALMLRGTAAAIPWELIRDGFDHSLEPVAVASGMIRQLLVDQGRSLVLRSPDRTALVVGNPKVSDPRFPSLGGAAEEATAVAELLRGDFQVHSLINEQALPMEVLNALHLRPWRILHLAAHGVYDFDPGGGRPRVSGLVLDEGLFLTPADADQLRFVPDLVFINCCHLGQMRNDTSPQVAFHKLAANVATQFIKMGARAVIAAGWAVDDAAAKTFATSFYRSMLNGELYGDAVLQARRDTWGRHANTNTWGAYQCYGDPSFSLNAGGSARRDDTFVSPAELSAWLEQRAADARDAASDALKRVEERVAQTPEGWWTSADLCATTAGTFAELGQYERAIGYYDVAVKAERALGTVRAVEQMANCRVRWAEALLKGTPPDSTKAAGLLDEAEKTLKGLLAIGETSERWSLLGGMMKRRAMDPNASAQKRRDALAGMSAAYKAAYQKSVEHGAPDPYPLANQLAADIVRSWSGKKGDKAVTTALADHEQLAAKIGATRTDAFNLSEAANQRLLKALYERTLSDSARDAIVGLLSGAVSRGASPRVKGSMKTQLAFFRLMMQTEFPAKGRRAMIAHVDRLVDALFKD